MWDVRLRITDVGLRITDVGLWTKLSKIEMF